ncbi:MAG: ABC transporter permease [Chloroflexota bacterium]
MTVFATIVELTLRALLGRRRTVLLVLLAALPVLVALLARVSGRTPEEATLFDAMVRTVLPLVALVFGTSALGSELEDGTAVYILAKPIRRAQVILAKAGVAGSLTGGLVVASTLGSGILAGGTLATTVGFAVAAAVAAFAYVVLFLAASVFTGRALILGLIYTLVWEGALAGILEGTRQFSIREATLSLAAALAPAGSGIQGGLELGGAVGLVAVVIAGGLALAIWRLAGWEVRGSD